jgi:hypothetical protein
MVKHRLRLTNINTQIFNQRACMRWVTPGILNKFGAAEIDEGASPVFKLIAFRVAAEVVVIVDNEDTRTRSQLFLVVVRCRQAADSTANNNQIVLFAVVDLVSRIVPAFTVPHMVSVFERAGVAAAHTCSGWWVVSRLHLGTSIVAVCQRGAQRTGKERSRDRNACTVQEITARDIAIHPKLLVIAVHG